jgi:MoaA/NifB/PqqE/SkfB family radical SAM enzyme
MKALSRQPEEDVKHLNVGMIEMLEPRPCGGFASRGNDTLLTRDDRNTVMDFFLRGNTAREFKDYPLIYHVAFTEAPEQAGCMMGGLSHLAIDSKGNVNPCVFLPVTFGNILKEDFAAIYSRMRRAIPRPLHKECPSLALAETLLQKGRRPEGFPIPHASIEKEWEKM